MSDLVTGTDLMTLAGRLYPICRSISGNGLRETLRILGGHAPLVLTEVPSGTQVYDWEVPLEWNIESARLTDPDGKVVVDFTDHNLHVVNNSEPVTGAYSLDELGPRLHTDARNPEWLPYKTSYYRRSWGFCLSQQTLQSLRKGTFGVDIKSRLEPGSLTFGEFVLPGASRREVLLFTHACHPSLANDNVSGLVVAAALAQWLSSRPRKYTWRLVFAPGTIGSLCWLRNNESHLHMVEHGLVIGLLGDSAPWTYKRSRRGCAPIDEIVPYVISAMNPQSRVIDFEPYGYDERQLCSPGFNLPVGRLTRSANDGYREYHSSADDLKLISADSLLQSLDALKAIAETVETNRRYINLSPKGEPRLGKRGLYGSMGGSSPARSELAMLWVLNQSDGEQSLLDIARRSGLDFEVIRTAANALANSKLLDERDDGSSSV